MHIGVSTRTVSTWKTRGTNPGAEYIAGIAEFFSVSTDYILTGSNGRNGRRPHDT
jgi:transcriptional regulator with XRE-family HTH domain